MLNPHPTPAEREQARRHYHAGLAHLDTGNEEAAHAAFMQALTLDDSLAPAHYQLGNCLRRRSLEQAAEQALQDAIQRDPSLCEAYYSLAFLYREVGRMQDVGPLLTALANRFPQDYVLQQQAGGLLADCGCYREAAVLHERLIRLSPKATSNYLRLAQYYQKLGRYTDTERVCDALMRLTADAGAAYDMRAHTRKMGPQDKALAEQYEQVLALPGLSEETRVCLHFGLGKIHDDMQRYDDAFAHFQAGNALRHASTVFDRDAWHEFFGRLEHNFSAPLFRNLRSAVSREPAPVFVVGMPRSGTTLVERIIASHPEALGIGEQELLEQLSGMLSESLGTAYPECVLRVPDGQWPGIAEQYRRQWPRNAAKMLRVVDKNPLNFMHLGLATILFPNARIIHCTRNPVDTCLSVYFQNFAHPRNTYAYDLEDIAFFHNCYRELMSHWTAVLPLDIHEVNYETLVVNYDAQARQVINAAGLEWHDDCLRPYDHPGSITTASVWQARQPVYTSSKGRARNYTAHIGRLLTALKQ